MGPDILAEDTERAVLLSAMDENLWAFWRDYGQVSGGELHESADLRWFASGIQLAVFNGVPYAKLADDNIQPALELIQASVNRRGAPAMWWVGPNTRPIGLAERLECCGLSLARIMIGMVIDLSTLHHFVASPAGFRIERVQGPDMRRLWARVVAEGSGFPDDAARALADLEPTLSVQSYAACPRYLGFLAGQPVATSVLVPAAGLAGIYAVSTVAHARRQGVGSAMTALPLLEAREHGYRLGMLQSNVRGHPVYKRLGFHDVCEYRCYSQPPSNHSVP